MFIVLLIADQTFSNHLNAHKEQLKNSLATASVISWAYADTAAGLKSQFVEAVYVEGILQPQQQFGLDH